MVETGRESLSLWVMPAGYAVTGPGSEQQTSIFLGSNSRYRVYIKVNTYWLPTWKTYEQDLKKALDVRAAGSYPADGTDGR